MESKYIILTFIILVISVIFIIYGLSDKNKHDDNDKLIFP
jgi:hypothetical protein